MARPLSDLQQQILILLGGKIVQGRDGMKQFPQAHDIAHALGRTQPSTKKRGAHKRVVPPAERVIVHKALARLCARGLVISTQRTFLGRVQTIYAITEAGLEAAEALEPTLPEIRRRKQQEADDHWRGIAEWHAQHNARPANVSYTRTKR